MMLLFKIQRNMCITKVMIGVIVLLLHEEATVAVRKQVRFGVKKHGETHNATESMHFVWIY